MQQTGFRINQANYVQGPPPQPSPTNVYPTGSVSRGNMPIQMPTNQYPVPTQQIHPSQGHQHLHQSANRYPVAPQPPVNQMYQPQQTPRRQQQRQELQQNARQHRPDPAQNPNNAPVPYQEQPTYKNEMTSQTYKRQQNNQTYKANPPQMAAINHPVSQGNEEQSGQEEQEVHELPSSGQEEHQDSEVQIMYWSQKCMTMLQRFEWFATRFQMLRDEYFQIHEEMKKIETAEDWDNFQQHHEDIYERIEEMDQEIVGVLSENASLLEEKRNQESDTAWEQRYQELLGNFKSLEKDLESLDKQNQAKEHNLREYMANYQQLQYHYANAINELNEIKGQGQISAPKEGHARLKTQLQSLQNQNVKLHQAMAILAEENQQLKKVSHKNESNEEYNALIGLLQEKEKIIKQQETQFKGKSAVNVNNYESRIEDMSVQLEEYKRLLNDKEKFYSETKQQLKEEIQRLTEELHKKNARVDELVVKLDSVQHFKAHKRQNSNLSETEKKKLNVLSQQVNSLNEMLKKKNQEIAELRSSYYELQKLREMQADYQNVVSEKDKNAETVKRKTQEIEELHRDIEALQGKLRQASNKRAEYNSKNLLAEIEDLNEHLRRKEGDVNKAKVILVVKEEYCEKLQEEVRKLKEQIITLEQVHQTERESFRQREISLSKRNTKHEEKLKDLDIEFSMSLKTNLENEVGELRRQNVVKQQRIRQLEEEEMELKIKLPAYEKQHANHEREMLLLNKRQHELEQAKEAVLAKLATVLDQSAAKDRQIDTYKNNQMTLKSTLHSLQTQLEESNNILKAKNQIVNQLQAQVGSLIEKHKQDTDKSSSVAGYLREEISRKTKEIDTLRDELEDLKQNSPYKIEMEKNERKIFTQLEEENKMLKSQVWQLLERVGTVNVPTQQVESVESASIYKRLYAFNDRLSKIIGQRDTETAPPYEWEREKKELINKYKSQIKSLKEKQEGAQGETGRESNNLKQSKMTKHFSVQYDKIRAEVQFYKQKLREQHARCEVLLNINEELKGRIQNILKIKQSSSGDYYREQCDKYEKENQLLRTKLKKLNQENKEYRNEVGAKNSRLAVTYETKIFDLEMQIDNLNRKMAYLQIDKAAADNARIDVLHYPSTAPQEELTKSHKSQIGSQRVQDSKVSQVHKFKKEFENVIGSLDGSPLNYQHEWSVAGQIYSSRR